MVKRSHLIFWSANENTTRWTPRGNHSMNVRSYLYRFHILQAIVPASIDVKSEIISEPVSRRYPTLRAESGSIGVRATTDKACGFCTKANSHRSSIRIQKIVTVGDAFSHRSVLVSISGLPVLLTYVLPIHLNAQLKSIKDGRTWR
jgi:hypothetical protein